MTTKHTAIILIDSDDDTDKDLSCSCSAGAGQASGDIMPGMVHSNEDVETIISIDLGTKNIAMAEITSNFEIFDWKIMPLHLPTTYSPKSWTNAIRMAIAPLIQRAQTGQRFILERQRFIQNNHTRHRFIYPIIRLNIVEAIFHSLLGENVESMAASVPSKHFNLDSSSTKAKKKSAVNRVKLILGNQRVSCPNSIRDSFLSSKKQDDLADCLLQALSYLNFKWE